MTVFKRTLFTTNTIYLILGLILTALLGFLFLGQKTLYLDEIATVYITQDWNHMFNIFQKYDGNMWFYYIIVYFWNTLGTNESTIRTLSVIFSIVSIPVIFGIAKDLFGEKTARITMLLTPINIFFIQNAQYARSYSLLLLLLSISTHAFIKLINKNSNLHYIVYVGSSILAVYTHIYSLFVIFSQLLFVLIIKKYSLAKNLIIALLTIVIFLIPLLTSNSIHNQVGWITPPSLMQLVTTLYVLSGDMFINTIIYGALSIWLFVFLYKDMDSVTKRNCLFLIIWIGFILFGSFFFSILVKPIFNERYMFVILMPILLLISFAIANIQNKKLLYLVLVIITLSSLFRLYLWYTQKETEYTILNNKNADWRSVNSYIENRNKTNDGIVFTPSYTQIVFDYYYEQGNKYSIKQILTEDNPLVFGNEKKSSIEYLYNDLYKHPRIWLVKQTDLIGDNRRNEKLVRILDSKYKRKDTIDFHKIKLTLYEN